MNSAKPCQVDSRVRIGSDSGAPALLPRRSFLQRATLGTASLTCLDFLCYFAAEGAPAGDKADRLARDAARAHDPTRFLTYWYLEGGWCGYDMFNPVMTDNNVLRRLENISEERYRILQWGEEDWSIRRHGDILHGYLANGGRDLFGDISVISSMHTGSGHSRDRLKVHMGDYELRQSDEREEDERSVMQAFAEVHGQPFVLPSLSWHWWLSDGELNEVQYRGRRGYYHGLGPVHAHTIYAGTPAKMKRILRGVRESSGDAVNRTIESFLEDASTSFLSDADLESVRSYHSAREIHRQLTERGRVLDSSTLEGLFEDAALRERFRVDREDELTTWRSVNGNKARSKYSPNVNVQAMMSYEMMRAGLSCAFFIESRDVRAFDSHHNRRSLWDRDGKTPRGMPNQKEMMDRNLWTPLLAYADLLKNTEWRDTGESLWDRMQIVITSEFGRSIHGNVDGILRKDIPEQQKTSQIGGQDISAHWKVTSCAFLGGNVNPGTQFGKVGEKTLMAIPILPDGGLDPAFDPLSGELRPGKKKHPESFVPNHGDIYATALALAGIDPAGRGRNRRPPLSFVLRRA